MSLIFLIIVTFYQCIRFECTYAVISLTIRNAKKYSDESYLIWWKKLNSMLEFFLALLLMEVSASTHFLNSIIYLYYYQFIVHFKKHSIICTKYLGNNLFGVVCKNKKSTEARLDSIWYRINYCWNIHFIYFVGSFRNT